MLNGSLRGLNVGGNAAAGATTSTGGLLRGTVRATGGLTGGLIP
jgi:hypothetical protein